MMKKSKLVNLDKRDSGIEVIGEVPWGTHFCLFYQSKEDLVDILVPYFKAGLENNEYCMWVTSEPLNQKDAENAIRKAIPNFEQYLNKKQIEIIPHDEWYLKNNEFNSQRVLEGWVDKLNYGLSQGFKGLRLTGNTFWLEEKDWKAFTDYEEEVNNIIGNYNMIGVCTYSLEKCGPYELLDVIHNHQFALIRREGKWTNFQSMEQIKTVEKLKDSEEKWRAITKYTPDHILVMDRNAKILFINHTVPDLTTDEVIGYSYYDFVQKEYLEQQKKIYDEIWNTGEPHRFETGYVDKYGNQFYFDVHAGPIMKEGKVIEIIIRSTDITERKKREQELRLHSEIMINLSDGVNLIRASDLIIVYANPRFEEMFGYNPGEIIGKHASIINAPTDKSPEETAEEIINLLKETGEWRGEIKNIKKDGTSVLCYANVSFFKHPEYGKVFVSILTDITERKKVEKEITDLSRFPSENPNPVLRVNKENVIYVNNAGQRLFNLNKGERIPSELKDFVNEAFMKNKTLNLETILDDKIYLFDTTPIPEGDYANIYGRDITERKKAEKELKESEAKLKVAIESLPFPFYIVDGNGQYTMQNTTAKKVWGDLIGKHPKDIANDEKTLLLWLSNNSRAFSGETLTNEARYDLSGDIRYFYDILAPVYIDNKVQNIIGVNIDITELKKVEQKLKESEEKLRKLNIELEQRIEERTKKLKESEEKWRSITKYTPDHILMMDRDAKILFINYTVPDLSIDEVVGRPIFDFVQKEDQELHRNIYDELLKNGEPRRFETGYVDKDGNQFYFEIHSGPVWKEDKVIGIINRSTDITERKITEQNLIESDERLKKLNNELEQRISERTEELRLSEEKYREAYNLVNFYKDLFAHDMNNILQGIVSNADYYSIFRNDPEKLKELGDFSKIVKMHVGRGTSLISKVRKLSKLEETEINLIPIDVFNVLNNSVKTTKNSFPKKNVSIKIEGLSKDLMILGNDLLTDIFDNVLNNAVKFSKDDNEITVEIIGSKIKVDDINYIKIEFKDYGLGVPDERKETLFTNLYSKKVSQRGMGIGLSLVKKIVDRYEGKIWVENRIMENYEEGSNFVVLLKEAP